MGALAHYLEGDGIATTQISLIREHTEIIRPPRALWVPFELGRPLGAPDDPKFQRRVLLAALELFDSVEGPLLVDFPDDAPGASVESDQTVEGWACPVGFAVAIDDQSDSERLRSVFRREVAELRPWYDLSVKKRNRTAIADFPPDSAQEFLDAFASGATLKSPIADVPLPVALRLAVQDLKAFYFEALTAQPGDTAPTSAQFNQWFWKETAAGRILKMIKQRCLNEADEALRKTGAMLLVPLDQAQS